MAENEIRHTKNCPNCGAKLNFSESESTVHCPCCDNDYSVNELMASSVSGAKEIELAVNSIDTSESGLAYLESITETMDWDDFVLNNPSLTIQKIDRVVDKIKIKFANKPDTWLFEFKSVLVPVNHKLAKLDELVNEIKEKYTGKDDSELLKVFDNYRFIVNKLIDSKEVILKKLDLDLKFMKKFSLTSSTLSECKKEYDKLESDLNNLVVVSSLYDIEAIKERTNEVEKELTKKLSNEGINVVDTYKSAIEAYLSNNKRTALDLFSKIEGYRDSDSYITKLSGYTLFDEIMECNGTTYILKQSVVSKDDESSKKKSKKKSVTSNFIGHSCLALFDIVDGVQQEKPIIKNIIQFVTSYCNKFYFVNEKSELTVYDFDTKLTTVLMKTNGVEINSKTINLYNDIARAIFLGSNEEEKKGCLLKGLFKKNKKVAQEFETFRLISLELATGAITTLDTSVLCISQKFDKDIFYTKGVFNDEGALERKEIMHINAKDLVASKPFNREVFIEDVVDGNIIYSLWEPNANNLDLYSLNIETKKVSIIEKNIYNYLTSVDNKVYYTIGNYKYQPLYYADPNGENIKEIAQNCDKILGSRNGYLYVIKGSGYNKSLIKIKADGSSRLYICSLFSHIEAIKNGYIYYIDMFRRLHIVRSDGCEDRLIANAVEDVLAITSKNIFFTRQDIVSDERNNEGVSLYYMDADGHNTHKAAFDIQSYIVIDSNTIYYSVNEKAKYFVKTWDEKDNVTKSEETYDVQTYYALNVTNLETTRVVMKGAPLFNSTEVKKGCFGKKVERKPEVARVEYVYPIPSRDKLVPNSEYAKNEDEDDYEDDYEDFDDYGDYDTSSKPDKNGCSSASMKGKGCGSKKQSTKKAGCSNLGGKR